MANYMSRGNEDTLVQQNTAPISPRILQWVKSFIKNGDYFLQLSVLLYEFDFGSDFYVLSGPISFEYDAKQLYYELEFEMPSLKNLYSSVCLTVYGLENTDIRLKLELEFWIKNKSGTKVGNNKKIVNIFDKKTNFDGFGDFLHYDELFSPKNGISKDDYLTVYCQIKKLYTPKLPENPSDDFFGFEPDKAIDRLIIAISNEDSVLRKIVVDYIIDCISCKDFIQLLKYHQNWKDFKKKNKKLAKKTKRELLEIYERPATCGCAALAFCFA